MVLFPAHADQYPAEYDRGCSAGPWDSRSMMQSPLQDSALQTLAALVSLVLSALLLNLGGLLDSPGLSLHQGLETSKTERWGETTGFLLHLFPVSPPCCLLPSELKTTVSCILFAYLVISSGMVNPVSETSFWLEFPVTLFKQVN